MQQYKIPQLSLCYWQSYVGWRVLFFFQKPNSRGYCNLLQKLFGSFPLLKFPKFWWSVINFLDHKWLIFTFVNRVIYSLWFEKSRMISNKRVYLPTAKHGILKGPLHKTCPKWFSSPKYMQRSLEFEIKPHKIPQMSSHYQV